MAISAKRALLSPFAAELHRMGDKLPSVVANAKRPATIQRIAHAAERIFAERGLDGARASAIARAARVNKALLYYYFRSKEDLYHFTLEMLFSQLRSQGGAALDEPGAPRERLLRYVRVYFDFVTAHPNYPRLIQRHLMSRGSELGGIVDEYYRPLHERLSATIRAGIARSEFREVDAQHTALTLVAMMVFYFSAAPVVAALWRCDPLEPGRVKARQAAVLDFLEHGLFAKSTRTR